MRFLVILILIPGILGQFDPHNTPGTHGIVHLFEWKWNDVAEECERWLAPKGFAGVQVSPASENAIVMEDVKKRPWFERYQPVSYNNFQTRSGSEEEYKDMIRRCNKAGVRIYVDVVINHMTGGYNGVGTGGTKFNGETKDYPGVPFSPEDFNGKDMCPSASGGIEDYHIAEQVRNCELVGLRDLKQDKENVKEAIKKLLNKHISFGVAGFRVDASKHMWPADMDAIFNGLDNLNTDHGFPSGSRAFIYQEVIDNGGEAVTSGEYTSIGRVTEFKAGKELGAIFRKKNPMKYLDSWGEEWGFLPSDKALVFIDNHDNQRGHGAGGRDIITFRDPKVYKMATAFQCAHPYGFVRIMSSFFWEQDWEGDHDKNDWIGPPHDSDYNTKSVTINSDATCGNGWVCEHRWRQIYNMITFRNAVGDEPLTNWWSGSDYQIAFSRGDKGFIVINNEGTDLSTSIQTGLPEGKYCDVISGNLENGKCTGKTISVGGDGKAQIDIKGDEEDPMVAIHVNF